MGNEIPTKQRDLCRARDQGRCLRCGMRAAELHHRRKRRGSDEHRHCPCNMVYLCHADHQGNGSVHHGGQAAALATGYVVSRHHSGPVGAPLRRWDGSWVLLGCDGSAEPLELALGVDTGTNSETAVLVGCSADGTIYVLESSTTPSEEEEHD